MKKLLLIVTMFFFCVSNIYADDNLVIENLKVNNGSISPKFNKYNNYYSVTISDSVNQLDFDLAYDDSIYEIEIINNSNLMQNKLVYITIYNKNNKEKNTYIFKVYIENIDDITAKIDDNELQMLDVKSKKEDKKMVAPSVGCVCFILILFVYYIMFLR